VVMREAELQERLATVIELGQERLWLAMEGIAPTDAGECLAAIEALSQGAEMSAPGPVIRRSAGGAVLVDAHALSVEIEHRLRLTPTGGAVANIASHQFELAVQRAIDDAGFGPDEPLRRLRGKGLRVGGQSVTDIDALLVVGNQLVCVSCKKIELARSYDAGNYVDVRNATTKVEDAVREWADRVAALVAHPVGDNYDFAHFDAILGIVVTPDLVYVESHEALEAVKIDGLAQCRRYISFAELEHLLEELAH